MGRVAGWTDSPVLAGQRDVSPGSGGPAGARPSSRTATRPRPTAHTDPLSPPYRRRPRSRVAAARDADGAVEDLQADGAAELRLQRLGRGAAGGRWAGGAGARGLGALRRRYQQAAEHGGGGRRDGVTSPCVLTSPCVVTSSPRAGGGGRGSGAERRCHV